MSQEREIVAWITKNGKHIPIYASDEPTKAEQKKERDIAQAKEQADRLNGTAGGKLHSNSTRKEIQDYYKNNFNMTVSDNYFDYNCEPEFLVKSADSIEKIYSEFPILKDTKYNLEAVDFSNSKYIPKEYENTTAASVCDYSGRLLVNVWQFNRNIFPDIADMWIEKASENFFPKNSTIYDCLIHELGHKVEIALAKGIGTSKSELNRHDIAEIIVKDAYSRLPQGMFKSLQSARKSISGYAGTNYQTTSGKRITAYEETFAEAIADYVINGVKSSQFSKLIVQDIKDIIEDF